MNYDPTRHQHRLFNIPRGYYYCQLSTPWWVRRSKMVFARGFRTSKGSSLRSVCFAMVPKGFSFECIGKNVFVLRKLASLIESRAAFESTPQTKKRVVNYTHLSLRRNLLLEMNFSVTIEQFPDLKTVDIRDNPHSLRGVGGGGEPFKVLMHQSILPVPIPPG